MKRLDSRSLTRASAIAASALALFATACGGDGDGNIVPDIQASDLTPLRAGTFVADGAGGAPDATGSISIARGPAGGLYVALGADFMVESGPGDTQLYLAKTADNIQAQRDADPASVSAVIGTWATTFWGIVIAGTAQIPVFIWLAQGVDWSRVGWIGVTSSAYLVAFSAILAYAAWYWSLNRGGVVRVAPLQFAQPLVGVAFAVLLLSEPLTLTLVLSSVMILAGVVLASRAKRR